MKLSVAICTWNRSKLLDQTLASFKTLRIPEGVQWEVIVIDNNCSDNTQEVLAKYKNDLPLVCLVETKQGQSHARNCAIDAATGDVIVWTDDDVQPDVDWLAHYVSAFRKYPDAAFFGGKIEPWYETDPPKWIADRANSFEGMLVIRDLGSEEREMTVSNTPYKESETPFGANMAIRTDWQRRFKYDPHLGKVKNSNVTADETDMFRRIRESNGNGIWVPLAKIKHFVGQQRMTAKYLWDYHYGQGQTLVRTKIYILPWNTPVFRHAPRWMVVKKYQAMLSSWKKWLVGNSDWASDYQKQARFQGMIDEFRATKWMPQPKEQDPTIVGFQILSKKYDSAELNVANINKNTEQSKLAEVSK